MKQAKQVVTVFVTSKHVYAAHTWGELSSSQLKSFQVTHARAIRKNLGKNGAVEAGRVNSDLLYTYGFLPIAHVLRKKRLRYVARVIASAPVLLRALFQWAAGVDKSWICMIRHDLKWLQEAAEAFSDFPCPLVCTRRWEVFMRDYPKA